MQHKTIAQLIDTMKKDGKVCYAMNCRKRVIENFDSNDRFREYIEKVYRKALPNP